MSYKQVFNLIKYNGTTIAELWGDFQELRLHGRRFCLVPGMMAMLTECHEKLAVLQTGDLEMKKFRQEIKALLSEANGEFCAEAGCERGVYSGGYCSAHYQRHRYAQSQDRRREWRKERD